MEPSEWILQLKQLYYYWIRQTDVFNYLIKKY